MKLVASLCLALGVATVVAGCLAFTFGLGTSDIILVSGWGPFDGLWEPADYCALGTILAAVGAGLTTFGLVWVALLFRHGAAILPRRRWVVWSLALLMGTAGIGMGVMSLLSQHGQRLSRTDAETARMRVLDFLVSADDEDGRKAMTTPEYQQRERSRKESVRYKASRCWTNSTLLHDSGQISVKGSFTATAKTTMLRIDGGGLVGGGVVKAELLPPQEIRFTARLLRSENNLWLIDELVLHED